MPDNPFRQRNSDFFSKNRVKWLFATVYAPIGTGVSAAARERRGKQDAVLTIIGFPYYRKDLRTSSLGQKFRKPQWNTDSVKNRRIYFREGRRYLHRLRSLLSEYNHSCSQDSSNQLQDPALYQFEHLGGWPTQALCWLEWGSSTAGHSRSAARSRFLAVHSDSICECVDGDNSKT